MRMRTLNVTAGLGPLAVVALLSLGLWAILATSAALRPHGPSERGAAPVIDAPNGQPPATSAPLLQLPEPAPANAEPSAVPAGGQQQPRDGTGPSHSGSETTPTGPARVDPKAQQFGEPIDPPITNVKPIVIGEDK